MARSCGKCGRTWGDEASFCGHCGALLDESATAGRDEGPLSHPQPRRRQAALLTVAVTAAVIAAVILAVPTIDTDRPDPVAGDVGVPDPEEVRPPATTALPADERPDPPPITCTRGSEPFDCVAWTAPLLTPETGSGPESLLQVVDDRLVVVGPDIIRGFDLATGAGRWRLAGLHSFGHVVAAHGLVRLRTNAGEVSLVDATDGTRRWTTPTVGAVEGEIITAELVYTSAEDLDQTPAVVARSPVDGDVRWRWLVPWQPGTPSFVQPVDPDRVLVFAPGRGGALLDTSRGQPLWVQASGRSPGRGRPWVTAANTLLYRYSYPSLDNTPKLRLTAVELADGSRRWQRELGGSHANAAVMGGLVVISAAARLTAIEATDGSVRWRLPTNGLELPAVDARRHGPVDGSGDHVVTLGVDGWVRSRAPSDGHVQWATNVGDFVATSRPVITDGQVVITATSTTRVFDLATGIELVTVQTPNWFTAGVDARVLFHRPSGQVAYLRHPPGP